MIVECVCPVCKAKAGVVVEEEAFRWWKSGEVIQRAMPLLSGDDRERLMTGICPDCWEKLFPEE